MCKLSAGCPITERKIIKFCSFLFFVVFLSAFASCKVVRISAADEQKAAERSKGVTFGDSAFDAKKYAADIWNTKVLCRINQNAIDIKTVVSGLAGDKNGICSKYGYRVGDEGSFYNFAVKGKIKILAVHTESRNGTLDADIEPFDGKKDITIQIGPVFTGTAIRDYLDFISINDFENQVEFAKLGTELNMCVRDMVVKNTDFTQKIGKEISLTGVFTLNSDIDHIVVTPVSFSCQEN
jgi:predicted lipoprotein